MADRNDGALQAVIKALEHAVQPAVDPADPLAGEQLKLAIGYLKLLRQRLPHAEERARFELEHYRAMAVALLPHARNEAGDVEQRFAKALAMADNAAAPADVRNAAAALASAISGLVRAVAQAESDHRRSVEHTVARHTRRWIDAQRAWFAPLGFELRPAELPPLPEALDAARTRG